MHKNILVRLVTYYLALFAVLSALFYAFPVLGNYLAAERGRQGMRASLELKQLPEAVPALPGIRGPLDLLNPERTVPIVLSLVVAVLVVLPIAWVYRWTRPHRRGNQAFLQTLLVVPIAITLVVFLVKDSLALAFSLAGIVAAVRFRTTLDEPIDAVYLFLVVGVGLAAGVQLLFVAFLASVVFNAVALAVWRLNVGSQPAVLQGWRLVEAAPAAAAGPASAAAGAAAPAPSGASAAPGDAYNSRLRLFVTDVEEAQRFAVPVLEGRAKKWHLAEISREGDGTPVLEFDLRLKKSVDLAAFIKELEHGCPHVTAVELKKSKTKQSEGE
jgi:hypothetical protein